LEEYAMKNTLLLCITCVLSFALLPNAEADVYYLNDGSVKVGVKLSRAASDLIKMETLQGIIEFPAAEVERLETCKELTRQYKELKKVLNAELTRSRITLALWCQEKGLYTEMFSLYDKVAERNPGDPGFRSFVYDMSLRIDYRGFCAKHTLSINEGIRLHKKMVRSAPTLKRIGEILLLNLETRDLTQVLIKGLASSSEPMLLSAIAMAAMIKPPDVLEPLIGITLFNRKEKVRAAALNALVTYQHDGIIYPYLRALKSKIRTHRYNALAALEKFNDARAVAALISNLDSTPRSAGSQRANIYVGTVTSAVTGFETAVAQGAAIASPTVSLIRDGALLDVNVLGCATYTYIRPAERSRIAQVLHSITGVDYGKDYLLWKGWWDSRANTTNPKRDSY
jgi:hypothetical protein